jgi:pyridoxamine 5'-phosphate oxidase
MMRDRTVARERRDATAEFACFATVDANGQPHARFVTIRKIDSVHVTFWASDASPKSSHLKDNGKYELTAYWPSLARQYRIQGIYHWIAASEVPDEYAVLPWRAKVWDWLHSEVPQSSPAPDRSSFVKKFESCGAELDRRFGGQEAVPPPANAGLVCLEPRRVEVQQIDAERRLHDRRLFIRERAMWTQEILVP